MQRERYLVDYSGRVPRLFTVDYFQRKAALRRNTQSVYTFVVDQLELLMNVVVQSQPGNMRRAIVGTVVKLIVIKVHFSSPPWL